MQSPKNHNNKLQFYSFFGTLNIYHFQELFVVFYGHVVLIFAGQQKLLFGQIIKTEQKNLQKKSDILETAAA